MPYDLPKKLSFLSPRAARRMSISRAAFAVENWFKYYDGQKESAPYILNGSDYMRSWVTQTIDSLRRGTTTPEITNDVMPDDVNDDLVDDMGWLSNMNRDVKSHKDVNDDIKITETLKRINDIMKKII